MNTKIYDGYRIKNITIEEFKTKYSYLLDYIKEKSVKNIYLYLSSKYYENLDNVYNTKPENVLEMIKKEIKDECEELASGRRSLDFDKDIGFFMKEYKGDLYLYMFYEDSKVKKILLNKIENIEDFSYWNNTDKPDEVSESHWDKRSKIWNELLTSYSFDKSGFETFYFFHSEDFLKNIQFEFEDLVEIPIEERSENYAFRQTVTIVDNKNNGKNVETFKMSTYMKSERSVKEGEYEELKNKIKKCFLENKIQVNKENFSTLISMENIKDNKMSTQIIDGMRIKNTKLEIVKKQILSLKDYYQLKMIEKVKRNLSFDFYCYIDNVFNTDIQDVPYKRVDNFFKNEIEKIKNNEISSLLSKSFVVYIKQHENDVYLYSFQKEKSEKEYLMREIPEIENFAYTDNEGRPKNISISHWRKRKKIWEDIYYKYTFEESGFEKIELIDMNVLLKENFNPKWLNEVTIEKRKNRAIKQLYITTAYEKIIKGLSKEEITESMYMLALEQYITYRNQDLFNEIKDYVSDKIRVVNTDNFYTINSLKKIKFKTNFEIKDW